MTYVERIVEELEEKREEQFRTVCNPPIRSQYAASETAGAAASA